MHVFYLPICLHTFRLPYPPAAGLHFFTMQQLLSICSHTFAISPLIVLAQSTTWTTSVWQRHYRNSHNDDILCDDNLIKTKMYLHLKLTLKTFLFKHAIELCTISFYCFPFFSWKWVEHFWVWYFWSPFIIWCWLFVAVMYFFSPKSNCTTLVFAQNVSLWVCSKW